MTIPDQIKRGLKQYTKQKESQLLKKLLSLQVLEPDQTSFNDQYEHELTEAFKDRMSSQKIQDVCSLLNLTWSSLKNTAIRKTVLVSVLDSILECIGIADLKQVLDVIKIRIGDLGELEPKFSLCILRIVNTLLKRISNTTDFHVRGELHMTITRIINLCHESGFDYRPGVPQISQKFQVQDAFLENFQQSNISLEFYENFWELQKYFMDIQNLYKNQSENSTPNKQDYKFIPIKLKKIQYIFQEVIQYFKTNMPIQNKDFTTFPLKFLKLPNLLVLQLQDSYFRLTILIQTLIFCSSLKHFPVKYPIQMTFQSLETVSRIQKKAYEYLENLLASRKDASNLISMINSFLKNDQFWIQLKDNWKQKKKTFFKTVNGQELKDLKRATSTNSQAPGINAPNTAQAAQPQGENVVKKQPSLAQVAQKCKKQIQSRMQIRPKFIQTFLRHTQAPVLKKQPIVPSFSYYYSQARSCLETFDQADQCQTQFQSRAEYNLFEWKAFRSLERERIIKSTDKSANNKLSDFKLLDFIKRNQEVLEGQPRKRIKPNQQDEEKDN